MEVTVLNRQRTHRVDRSGLSTFIERLARECPGPGADGVAVCLVSDRRMREYQRRFRGRDATTDVLAFAGDLSPDVEGRVYLGDIVISVPAAARQARDAGHGLSRELKILALHGYLHLLGYDHERDDGTMLRQQRRLARRLLEPRRIRARER